MELAEARSVLARALEHPEWLFSQPDAAGRRSDAWGASRRAIQPPPSTRGAGPGRAATAQVHAHTTTDTNTKELIIICKYQTLRCY